jgi:Phage integrase, N-terminal SAM-like domain
MRAWLSSKDVRSGETMEQRPKKRLDRMRDAIRLKHYSLHTEHAYVTWITRDMFFHDKRHPKDMGAAAIDAFLTQLAGQQKPGLLRSGLRPRRRSEDHDGARKWRAILRPTKLQAPLQVANFCIGQHIGMPPLGIAACGEQTHHRGPRLR